MLGPAVLCSPARETFTEMHPHESCRTMPWRYNAHVGARHAICPVRSSAAWIHPRDLTLFFSAKLQARQSRNQLRSCSSLLTSPPALADCACQGSAHTTTSPLQTLCLQTAPALSPILSIPTGPQLPGGQWANCPVCCSPNRANPACLLSPVLLLARRPQQVNSFFPFFFLSRFGHPASSPPKSSPSIWARNPCQGSLLEHWVRPSMRQG